MFRTNMLQSKKAQEFLDRLEASYRNSFDFDEVSKQMREYYKRLGVEVPKIVCIENMEDAYKAVRSAVRSAAWSAARSAAWSAAWSAVYFNTVPKNDAAIKYIEVNEPLLKAVESGLGWFFPMQDQLILVPMPKVLLDTNKRAHSEEGKAVEWRDECGYYFLHGVQFEEKLYWKSVRQEMNFKEVMGIKDIDQRWVAMKLLGDKILDGVEKELLEKSSRGNELWKVKSLFSQHAEAYFLRYSCPSTQRVYFSGIDPEIGKQGKADLAMCWKHGIPVDVYEQLVEA